MLHLYLKRFLLAVLAISFSCNLFAQEQVVDASKKLDDQYDRNSVSVVVISNNSHYQNDIYELFSSIFDAKFDKNDIATTQVQFSPQADGAYETKLDGKLNNMNIGKEVVAYWLNRQRDGKMDDERIQARANYNATDEDVIHAAASQVSRIYEDGMALLGNSYVIAVKGDVERKITKDKKTNKTKESYHSDMTAYVYQLIFDKADLENIYTNMWIEDTDDAATKKAKNKLWDDLKVQMRRVAIVSSTGSSTESTKYVNGSKVIVRPTPRAAIESACGKFLNKFEKKLPDWQVKSPIFTTHPITAKIGKKEGLRNGSRYKVFQYIEDENGELSMKKKGFVRATTIADNRIEATGESPTSRFYQIAGTRLEEGMLLRQSNDVGLGVSAYATMGGLGFGGAEFDYLLHINNFGCCSYGIFGMGFDYAEVKGWGDNSFLYLDLGFGIGVPLTRFFELRPSFSIGMDGFFPEDAPEDEEEKGKYSGVYAKPSLRFSWQVYYPVRLFVQADYNLVLGGGSEYHIEDQTSKFLGMPVIGGRGGLGLSAGVRVAF